MNILNKNRFLKLWGMPILMSMMSITGLIAAILGTGFWHALSWLLLSYPLYIMLLYGKKFFNTSD
jgi:hypothetical protein